MVTNPEATVPLACACASLRRAARAVTQLYDGELRSTGLRSTQFTLLQALHRTGAIPQGRLGRLLALDSTTLSRSLGSLEARGWVRGGSSEDRRERLWRLTAAGRRMYERGLPHWERAQARLRQRLGSDGWRILLGGLTDVADALRGP